MQSFLFFSNLIIYIYTGNGTQNLFPSKIMITIILTECYVSYHGWNLICCIFWQSIGTVDRSNSIRKIYHLMKHNLLSVGYHTQALVLLVNYYQILFSFLPVVIIILHVDFTWLVGMNHYPSSWYTSLETIYSIKKSRLYQIFHAMQLLVFFWCDMMIVWCFWFRLFWYI